VFRRGGREQKPGRQDPAVSLQGNRRAAVPLLRSGDGYFGIQTDNGLCLDATYGGTGDGTPLRAWLCTGGENQQFQLVNVGGSPVSYLAIVVRHSGKCLRPDPHSKFSDKAQIGTYSCDGNEVEHWRLY
jgi:hypothetical protein